MAHEYQPGDRIDDKYVVERVLGEGGMGVVLAARHEALQRNVAVKLMHPALAEREQAVTRFLREGRAAARLRNPHVAQVLDVSRLPTGEPYIVLELLEGEDLGRRIARQGPMPEHLAADYLLQACESIAEAHAKGIVHRDLKPANLFITVDSYGEPLIKVLDFGISKLTDLGDATSHPDLTNGEAFIGSPQYMAPEQVRSAKDVDSRTDIWSLGTILYEMVVGRPAFSGDAVGAVLAAVLSGPSPCPRQQGGQISEEFAAVVRRCLQKSPAQRFTSVAELASALSPFAGEQHGTRIRNVIRMSGKILPHADSGTVQLDAGRGPQTSAAWGKTKATSSGTTLPLRRGPLVGALAVLAVGVIGTIVLVRETLGGDDDSPGLVGSSPSSAPVVATGESNRIGDAGIDGDGGMEAKSDEDASPAATAGEPDASDRPSRPRPSPVVRPSSTRSAPTAASNAHAEPSPVTTTPEPAGSGVVVTGDEIGRAHV